MVKRTDHKKSSQFVLGDIGPNAPTCSDWTTWHVARNSQTSVREWVKWLEKKTVERRTMKKDEAIQVSWRCASWRDDFLR
jgi:hypothetical protein